MNVRFKRKTHALITFPGGTASSPFCNVISLEMGNMQASSYLLVLSAFLLLGHHIFVYICRHCAGMAPAFIPEKVWS